MIRFSCPQCQREYELHDAMFGLPLLCKGCGQRLTIPAPSADPPPKHEVEPEPQDPAPAPLHLVVRKVQHQELDATRLPELEQKQQRADTPRSPVPEQKQQGADTPRSPEPEDVDVGFLSAETIAKLDVPVEAPTQMKAWEKPVPAFERAPSSQAPALREKSFSPIPRGKLIGIAADVAVVSVLVLVGVFLGEFAAGKSTREVMELVSGPKFPPLELLLWLAGPVLLLLIYALLASRGKTVGAWLRRRASS